jgi:hypothetical protein
MRLPDLFHWTPADNYRSIMDNGLQLHQPARGAEEFRPGYLCLAPDPRAAWSLSGGMDRSEIEEWDLWVVTLHNIDEVRIRPDFGPHIVEVRVHNPISADRLWYVGRRDSLLRPE